MNTDLGPGSVFAGRYVIGQVLGDGGYGRVFEAQDHEVGRRVALKVLRPDMQNGYSHEKRERFRREAATVANLQDPHTVTLFDHGETQDGLLYMVFEFVNGTPLNQLLKRGPLRPEIATRIIRQVLQSLREAHSVGILHRDLKPENIIVHDYGDEQYRAKLVDFGLAKSTLPNGEVPLTASGLVMGTAAYVSPEAYRLEQLSPASDLFGLGLVFYEMVVGHPANQAGSAMEIATQMVDPAEFVVPASVTEPTRSIITRMIRKNPRERYQSAPEVLAHLPETTLDSPFSSQSVPAPRALSNGGINDSTRESMPSHRMPKQHQAYSQAQQAPPQQGYGQQGYSQAYGAQQGYAPQQQPQQQSPYAPAPGYDPTRPPTLIEGQRPEDLLDDYDDYDQPATMIQPHLQYSQAQPHLQPEQPIPAPVPQQLASTAAKPPRKKRSGGVIGFTLGLVVLLFTLSAGLINLLDIRMPWEPRGAHARPDTLPPKVFDLTSTDTTFLWVDWTQGILLARDPGQIPAAGRCALILDSLSQPTPRGSYYVINALEPVDPRVTAYAVGPEELKLIAGNCYDASEIADGVFNTARIMAGEKKIKDVERRNEEREQRRSRAREMDGEEAGGQPDMSKLLKGGGMNIFQQFLK